MPRFVLLHHECPSHLAKPSHWDFMLQQDHALVSYPATCALGARMLGERPTEADHFSRAVARKGCGPAALATWQLLKLPADWHRLLKLAGSQSENSVLAERLADHRLVYLDYEGPISGNRGEVRRIEAGTFEVLQQSDSRLQVVLSGKRLRSVVELTRDAIKPQAWRLHLS